jgi:hypothetical protein
MRACVYLSLLDSEQAGMVQMVADHLQSSGMLRDPGALFTYYQLRSELPVSCAYASKSCFRFLIGP